MTQQDTENKDYAARLEQLKEQEKFARGELEAITRTRIELEKKRVDARQIQLRELAEAALVRFNSLFPRISEVREGAYLSADVAIDFNTAPRPGKNEIAVQFYSSRERKGNVDCSDKVDYRNPSYQETEMVVMQVVIPRADIATELDKFKGL